MYNNETLDLDVSKLFAKVQNQGLSLRLLCIKSLFMRTIIIDDIKKNREVLLEMLSDFCPQVEVIGEAEDVEVGVQLIEELQPDLVLLDVEMPSGTGFDLLEQLKEISFEVVFVTAYDRYALKAIKFCALDYILKPIDIKELIQAVHRAEKKLAEKKSKNNFTHLIHNIKNKNTHHHRIALPTQEGFIFIEVHDIIRCEAEGSYTQVFLKNKNTIFATRKIKGFEELLNDYNFFRVHRSHLINMNYIEKYHKGEGGYVVLTDGTSIDVSRRKKDEFLERLNSV